MKRLSVSFKENEGKKFYFRDFGSEGHGRASFRLWISSNFVKEDDKGEYIELPLAGCEIIQGKSSYSYILKKGNYNLFYCFIPCGYRGGSNFFLEEEIEGTRFFNFEEWKSPQGSLGVSAGALILTPESKLTIRWERTGRLYGDPPEGTTILYLDGREEEGIEEDIKELE